MHLLLFFLSLLFVLPVQPAERAFNASKPITLVGRASHIADGDSFTLLTPDKQQHRIRLNAIDAPEKKQDFYNAAKEKLGALLTGQVLRVSVTGRDRYGRLLADVFTPGNDSSVNLRLISRGLAWHFTKYSTDPSLQKAEQDARLHKRGLWQQPQPLAPWLFRAARRSRLPTKT